MSEEVITCDSLKQFEDALNYSKSQRSKLSSGQLFLSESEAKNLNKFLSETNSCISWKFEKQAKDLTEPKASLEKVKPGKSRLATNSSEMVSPDRKKRITKASSEIRAERANTPPTKTRVPQVSQSQIKRLSEWAQNFHSILTMLSKTELFKNFVDDIPPTEVSLAQICEKIKPGLSPIGIWTIISKLEQNGYQNALDAFNDVYSVWMVAYRIYTPGSPLWMQTYQASRAFFQQAANYLLKDNFTAKPTMSKIYSDEESDETSSSYHKKKSAEPESTANVEEIFQEFFTLKENSEAASLSVSETPQPVSRPKSKVRTAPPSITDAERKTFKSYLSQLEIKHHLRLFEAFQKAAIWKVIEGGEVELDDAKTNPTVFRKMIAWCRSQMTVESRSKQQMYSMDRKGLGKSVPGVSNANNLQQVVESNYTKSISEMDSSSTSSSSDSEFSDSSSSNK